MAERGLTNVDCRGNVHNQNGDFDEAVTDYIDALSISPLSILQKISTNVPSSCVPAASWMMDMAFSKTCCTPL
jgi:hypothetical protein